MKIIEVKYYPNNNTLYRAIFDDGVYIDFGELFDIHYIQHGDLRRRQNYWHTHYNCPYERELLFWLIPSPILLTTFLLNGSSKDIKKNIDELNKEWEKYPIFEHVREDI
jgi:hypothetical protein